MNVVSIIVIAVAIIGFITTLLFTDLLAQILNGKKFLKNSQKRKGFSDLLNYAAYIDDGIIICKDGSFIAAWEYKTGDTVSTTDAEKEQLSAQINNAIKDLGTGWIFSIDSVRTETNTYSAKEDSDFPDEISLAIDNERRAYFESQDSVYETKTILTVVWVPPLLSEQKLSDLMFVDDSATSKTIAKTNSKTTSTTNSKVNANVVGVGEGKDVGTTNTRKHNLHKDKIKGQNKNQVNSQILNNSRLEKQRARYSQEASTNKLIAQFKKELGRLELRLGVAFKLTRLKTYQEYQEDGECREPVVYDKLLEHLNFCITGKNHPIRLPNQLMYLDSIIGGHDFFSAVTPKIDNTFMQIINIEGFPNESYPGILNILSEMPCEYRWNTRFIFMDEVDSIAIMDKYRKKWRQKIRGFFDQLFNTSSGRIDADALSMMHDSEEAITEVKGGYVASGFYTSVVVIYDESRERLNEAVLAVQRQILKLGFK